MANDSIKYDLLPEHLRGGVKRWIEQHILPGDFLRAVIRNDLHDAVLLADDQSLAHLLRIVAFFDGEAPANCWGSREKLEAWAALRGKAAS